MKSQKGYAELLIVFLGCMFIFLVILGLMASSEEGSNSSQTHSPAPQILIEDLSNKSLLRYEDTVCLVPKGETTVFKLDTCFDAEERTLTIR